jgi:hypothetical protein
LVGKISAKTTKNTTSDNAVIPELYYGGEAVSFEHAMSYTCPYCGNMGFNESQLQDHVNVEHADSTIEVICPVCAALPHGDPNHLTEDFPAHLALEHRPGRDLDDPSIRHMRRMLHPGRGLGGMRAARRAMHHYYLVGGNSGNSASSSSGSSQPPTSTGGAAAVQPSAVSQSSSGRESDSRDVESIADILSQLSGVQRGGSSASALQLQQLQMQLQLERQQVQEHRRHLERLAMASSGGSTSTSRRPQYATIELASSSSGQQKPSHEVANLDLNLTSLLPSSELSGDVSDSDSTLCRDKCSFLQELVLSSLSLADNTIELSLSSSNNSDTDDDQNKESFQRQLCSYNWWFMSCSHSWCVVRQL